MFDEFFTTAAELRSRGVPFATAIVVHAAPPSSAKPGDKAIVTLDGVMHGWIGGSCAQPTVVEEAVRAIADGQCRLVRLSPEGEQEPVRDGVEVRPMTCYSGGTLEIYIEPQQPPPKLVVVGHLPVAQALVHLGRAMSYRVVLVDPGRSGAVPEGMSDADEVRHDLEAIAEHAGPLTYVVIASHGYGDEAALEQALTAPLPYVGLVASRRRAATLRAEMERRGLGSAELSKLKAPAGLDIGAGRGDEIALSIMAEIVQHRRHQERLDWPIGEKGEATLGHPAEGAEGSPAGVAVDPVCGMTVVPGPGVPRHEHAGREYFFCCAGCRDRFAREPEHWLAARQSGG